MSRTQLDAVRVQRELRRDEQRLVLGQLLEQDRELSQQIEAVVAEQTDQLEQVAAMSKGGRVDVRAAAARRYHAAQLRSQAVQLTTARQQLAQQIDAERAHLAATDADVKAVENLIEKRRLEAERETARKEQLQLEDEWAAGQQAG